MASYDPYEREYSRRYVREERREERDPRYLDTRDYTRGYPSRDLVPRAREDSDLSIEEVRRDFPPPSGRDIRRARSAEPDYYEDEYDPRRRYERRDYDPRARRGPGSVYIEEEEERRPKSKGMSKQEKIIAAVAGAALLVGGKELYDRHEAKGSGSDVNRNALSSAALAGVGALAGYQGAEFYSKQQAKKDQKATYILHRGRDGHITEYYSDEEGDPKEKKSNKNFLESALAATGLGAAVKTLTGRGDDDKRSDVRSRAGSLDSRASSPSRTRNANKMQKAAMASLLAGATEAFRVSKEPGGWKGEKTRRILTAAAGAATVDAAQKDSHGKLGLAESVIGGLIGNRLINGSKNEIEEDRRTGRSRSRSRARSSAGGGGGSGGASGLAALATAGLGALGAKNLLDRSRSRGRRSDDSRSPSPDRRRQRSRSRSVVDKARNSLAKLGIGAGAGAGAAAADDYHRRDQDDFDGGSRRSRRYSDDMYEDGYRQGRDYDDRSYRSGGRDDRDRPRRRGGRSDYDSETDLGDSSEDEKRVKKMKGKLVLTTGLAAVATIHAAHEVYQSMESRSARQKAVSEGRLSPAEAKKLKTKAMMQDAASVGIAALGIKGAVEELKGAKKMRSECREFQQEKARRHEKRMQRRNRSETGPLRRPDTWSEASRPRLDGYDADDDYGPRYIDNNPYNSARLGPPPSSRGSVSPHH
ncbi:hypothetical protein S40285_05988 [Stachybotrys chlorohalonatus IBT 40285]|uniref:DUF3824 domain-containing protein n=1 Tax=Stachybotrys chlorohalonatus (strain IBT 40285) TaxID=1283841 RepID=A0A084QBG9_STAC4|nr:hypothetical protein S40285_05988 [Stachybotrys chlorohalonata IBT 40285]